jgi:glycosyltransferase involved in cell wall biosynthesis
MIRAKKRIVLCFGVLDEADIIEYFLTYHLSTGIDAFVAVDVGSTDGTLDILREHERAGYLHLLRAHYADWESTVPMIETAREQCGAEWCLFGDADEFWIFPGGHARVYLDSASTGIVIFPRYNVVPSRVYGSVAHFSDFNLIVHNPIEFFYHAPVNSLQNFRIRREQPDYARMLLSNYPPEILRVIAPKVAARAEVVQTLVPGFHDIVSIPTDAPRHREQIGYIAHFPTRSLKQFRRKAALIARRFDQIDWADCDPVLGWHWARLSVLFKHKLVDHEFFRQVLGEKEIDRLLAEGIIRRDPSLSKALASKSWLATMHPNSAQIRPLLDVIKKIFFVGARRNMS